VRSAEPSPLATPATGQAPALADLQAGVDGALGPVTGLHGGALEVVEVRDRELVLRPLGACRGCRLASSTLAQVLPAVRAAHPEVTAVVLERRRRWLRIRRAG
jgi:Fe-S cluster biogenesis protein NfuA